MTPDLGCSICAFQGQLFQEYKTGRKRYKLNTPLVHDRQGFAGFVVFVLHLTNDGKQHVLLLLHVPHHLFVQGRVVSDRGLS